MLQRSAICGDDLTAQMARWVNHKWISQVQAELPLEFIQHRQHDQLLRATPDITQLGAIDLQTVSRNEFTRIEDRQRQIGLLDILQPVESAMFAISQQ